ncbi:MAG: KH domain-containing protein [Methanobacteriota archaeon]
MQYVKIPKERVGVLIGGEGKTLKEIEERTKTKITVEETSVSIEGDPVDEWITKDILKAVGRGFTPEKSLMLTQEDMAFEVLNLADIVGESDKSIARIKGRIIGSQGKSREKIENLTDCYVSVYGKTVCIIGTLDATPVAREAILMLASGSPHSNVYRFLERSKRHRKTM